MWQSKHSNILFMQGTDAPASKKEATSTALAAVGSITAVLLVLVLVSVVAFLIIRKRRQDAYQGKRKAQIRKTN